MISKTGIMAAMGLFSVVSGCASSPPPPPPPKATSAQVQVNFNFMPEDQLGSYKNVERGAISGMPQHVGFYYSVKPDCSSGGLVKTQVKSAPTHGSVQFVNADGYSGFPPTSASHECNTKKSPGVEVIYTSAKDFVGTDKFTVQGIGPKGKYMETDYTVKVLAP
jgi:hypothetical protein